MKTLIYDGVNLEHFFGMLTWGRDDKLSCIASSAHVIYFESITTLSQFEE